MRITCRLFLSAFLFGAVELHAAELYVVNFDSETPVNPGSCSRINWQSDVVFHNSTAEDARVRVLGLSNGFRSIGVDELIIPAGRTLDAPRPTGLWGALPPDLQTYPALWVARIDVPEGIVVQNRAEASFFLCSQGANLGPALFGAFSLPVIRTLIAPNVAKIHLGVDLGAERSYVNVGIYNAASDTASATVELRRACDDSVIDRKSVAIPGNSVVQVGGLDAPVSFCDFGFNTPPYWVRYVAVTVDRPSFSYVVSKMNELPDSPQIPYAATSSP